MGSHMNASSILIVEDENIAAMNLERKLTKLGYTVTGVVSSARAAIHHVRENEPSLVLMDIALKGEQDGVDAAREIHDSLDIPVVYLTALTDDETVKRAKGTDPFGYLIKPWEEKSLSATIEIALYKHQLERRLKEEIEARKRAEAELKRSNIELERFTSVASHDLREPLRTISSYVQLLERDLKGLLGPDALQYLDYVRKASNRMRNLIDDLLSYAGVGRKHEALIPVNCDDIVKIALSNLKTLLEEVHAEIKCGPLPTVLGNGRELTSLFQNLLGNALKYRGDKIPMIQIQSEEKDGEWLFSVRDNGIGIAPEDKERIFVAFQRLHTQEAYTGTGIGLAICQKIVEIHGGKIWVESAVGSGSTFYFTIPLLESRTKRKTVNG